MKIVFGEYSVKELNIDGKKVGFKFGFEASSKNSFFTLAEKNSHRIKKKIKAEKGSKEIKAEGKIKMKEAEIKLKYKEEFSKNKLKRDYFVLIKKDSEIMDLVQRFRFDKKYVKKVKLGGKEIKHRNSHINHSTKANKIEIFLEKKKIEIKTKTDSKGLFQPILYARDSGQEWVVHYRLLPTKPWQEIVKINYPGWDICLPDFLAKIILKSEKIKRFLWYKGEKGSKGFWKDKIKLNAYAIKKIEKDVEIKMKSELRVVKWEN